MRDARVGSRWTVFALVLLVASGCGRCAEAPAPPPPDASGARILETRWIGDYPKDVLERVLGPGVTIDNGYAVHELRFRTGGLESWATVTIPIDVEAPPGGWHVVANAHGTVGVDDPCAIHGTATGAGLAGLFGARGAIGVAVDYPGLGTPGVHPYLVADVEGAAVLDGLRAADELAATLGVPTSGRHAIVGLSQGGHAALAAAARHRALAPDLDLRAVAVSGPATVWERQWALGVGVSGAHVPLHAMTFYAWAAHHGWPASPSLWTDATAARIDDVMTTRCVFAAAGAPGAPGATIVEALPHDPARVFAPAFLDEYRTGRWDAYRFVHDAFAANAIGPYPQTAPLRIYQGDADDIVPAWATAEVVEALRAGGVEVDYQLVAGGGHDDVAFGFVAYPQRRTAESIAWVRQRLDGR